jgi:hypothetical protein
LKEAAGYESEVRTKQMNSLMPVVRRERKQHNTQAIRQDTLFRVEAVHF